MAAQTPTAGVWACLQGPAPGLTREALREELHAALHEWLAAELRELHGVVRALLEEVRERSGAPSGVLVPGAEAAVAPIQDGELSAVGGLANGKAVESEPHSELENGAGEAELFAGASREPKSLKVEVEDQEEAVSVPFHMRTLSDESGCRTFAEIVGVGARQHRKKVSAQTRNRISTSSSIMDVSLFGQDGSESPHTKEAPETPDSKPAVEEASPESMQGCRRWVCKTVQHQYFDYTFGALILLNAVSIGVQTEHMAHSQEEDPPLAFQICDSIFCVLFTLELGLRLVAYRLRFFCMTGWRWNWFDAVLVTMQVFEEITMIVARVSLTDSDTEGGGNLSFLRVLRILRLVRVVRLARVLRLVRQLRTLVTSIGASLQSLAWTVMLIVFIIYVVGIYFTQLVTNERIGATAAELDSQNMQMMARYFGTLERSCLSLFQSISGGVSWEIILSPLVEDVSWLVAPLFTLYIAFSLLAMMNVVTGVFVESALQSSAEDKEEFFASQLLELIMQHGENDDGYLWAHVLEGMVANPETAQRLAALDIKKAEALNLFKLIDIEKTGGIPINSFIMGCLRLRGAARSIDVATMMFEQKRFLKEWQAHAAYMEGLIHRLSHPGGDGTAIPIGPASNRALSTPRRNPSLFSMKFTGRAVNSLEQFVGRSRG